LFCEVISHVNVAGISPVSGVPVESHCEEELHLTAEARHKLQQALLAPLGKLNHVQYYNKASPRLFPLQVYLI